MVSTLEVLLGGAGIASMFTAGSALVFLVFSLLYTPCVAAIAAILRMAKHRGRCSCGSCRDNCGGDCSCCSKREKTE